MRRIFLIFFLGVLLTACAGQTQPGPGDDSGLEGQVFTGPMCPVMVEGQECPDRPYQATLTVLDPQGKQILRFQTDEKGVFSINLPPGEYLLVPESPEGSPFPFADRQEFSVFPGQFTRIIVSYDSGIR